MKQSVTPRLSICIPTYNRGSIVYEGIINTLKLEIDDYEIIVSDNCSPDNTKELIESIKDERVKYFRNHYNNGANNLLSVMKRANGQYLLLISDEDDIDLSGLKEVMKVIESDDSIAVIISNCTNQISNQTTLMRKIGNNRYKKGYEAMEGIGFGLCYMSGIFYKREYLEKITNQVDIVDINGQFGLGYTHMYLAYLMCEYGDLVTKNKIVCRHVRDGKRDKKTYFAFDGAWAYSPKGRTFVAKEFIDCFHRTSVDDKSKYELCAMMVRWVFFNCVDYLRLSYDDEVLQATKETLSPSMYRKVLKQRAQLVDIRWYKMTFKYISEMIGYVNQKKILQQSFCLSSFRYKSSFWTELVNIMQLYKKYSAMKKLYKL